MNKISIIIPFFNEEQNIEFLLNEILNNLDILKYEFELILINDASTDSTLDVINRHKDRYNNIIQVITNEINLGQSFSLLKGIKLSNNNTIVTLDGDGQNNPNDIPKLLNKYFSSNKIFLVGGLRKKRKDTFVKIFSSVVANYVRRIVLKDGCADTGCSLKVFDKKMFLNFPKFAGMHRFLPALFKGYGAQTFFIEVDHRPRIYGKSKYGIISRLVNGLIDLVRVYRILKSQKYNIE